jgi:phosphonate transport system substrate-binding protein
MQLHQDRLMGLLRLVILFVTSLGIFAQASEKEALPNRIVIALKPDKNPDEMLAEKKALESFLSVKLGRPVEVIIPLSSAVILEGFSNGTIDLGYLGPTDLINGLDQNVADLLLAGEIEGKTFYESYWVTLKGKSYKSIDDLRGKPVAFASKTSTSGFVIPLWDLHKKGLISDRGKPEEFFGEGNIWFGSGYVSAIERVLNGDAEAAAVSSYVLDGGKHLDTEKRVRLKRITVQGPVPTHAIAVRSSLSPEARATLRQGLEAFNEPLNQNLRDRVFTSKLVAVDSNRHLSSLREALRLAKSAW